MAGRGPEWADWVDRLPALLRELLEEWQLTEDGWMMHGFVALVAPVRTVSGRPAVLKVGFPDEESRARAPRAAALGRPGRGHAAARGPAPLRRCCWSGCTPSDLDELWDVEACEIVAGLYARLHVPALPQLRRLTSYVERRADELAGLPAERAAAATAGRAGGLARP